METDDNLSSDENLLGLVPYIFETRREYETSYSTTESVYEHETGDQIGPSYQMQISGNLSKTLPIASNHSNQSKIVTKFYYLSIHHNLQPLVTK